MMNLQEKIRELPKQPGCYIFKNKSGHIIYVGKSKALKNRVQQYFQNVEGKEGKYKRLAMEAADLEIILTGTERDALILECRLIKKHLPKYNVQMKRRKNYPYICINSHLQYPTISIEKEYKPEKGEYFGFFRNEDVAFEAITLMNHIWNTPVCGKSRFAQNHRPCLNYHLKKCCGPCCRIPAAGEYQKSIQEIKNCLNGQTTAIQGRLSRKMRTASLNLEFEKASHYRDMIAALERLGRMSRRLNTSFDDREVCLFFRGYHEKEFALFYIEDGRVNGRADFSAEQQPQFEAFVDTIYSNNFSPEEEADQRFLTRCLVDIYADKYYINISRRAGRKRVVRQLDEAFREFTLTEKETEK